MNRNIGVIPLERNPGEPPIPWRGLRAKSDQPPPPRFQTFWTMTGGKDSIPMYHAFETEEFFNGPGVTELIRDMCDKLPLTERLNDVIATAPNIFYERVREFFHLPPQFANHFWGKWGVVTINQTDMSTHHFYLMVIIHNGSFKNEYEIFSHMHGDERNVMIFEATNYAHYEDISLGRFNVD